ncbi:hypothetical protein J6590_048882 [Homalodisca vitripennis]|nr:hypothetical protein J6590_048882 [Homalodisca vitripennis]
MANYGTWRQPLAPAAATPQGRRHKNGRADRRTSESSRLGQVCSVTAVTMPASVRANGESGGKHVLVWNQIDLDPEDKNASSKPIEPEGYLYIYARMCMRLPFIFARPRRRLLLVVPVRPTFTESRPVSTSTLSENRLFPPSPSTTSYLHNARVGLMFSAKSWNVKRTAGQSFFLPSKRTLRNAQWVPREIPFLLLLPTNTVLSARGTEQHLNVVQTQLRPIVW